MTVKEPEQNRFSFGENWSRFLKKLDDASILEAESSLSFNLNVKNLKGQKFLDIGSGSGLFSLAARKLGAQVYSFDYDGESVACTNKLKSQFYPEDSNWRVDKGDVLSHEYMRGLGKFDVVYSWGVLHHTGAMWLGIDNAVNRVANGGKLFIAIYNDQGFKSHVWWIIKYTYAKLPRGINKLFGYSLGIFIYLLSVIKYALLLKPHIILREIFNYKSKRGMNIKSDLIDWVGGFPFEFATYELLQQYVELRGFTLVNGKKATSLGCHELIFEKHLIDEI